MAHSVYLCLKMSTCAPQFIRSTPNFKLTTIRNQAGLPLSAPLGAPAGISQQGQSDHIHRRENQGEIGRTYAPTVKSKLRDEKPGSACDD